MDERKKAVAWAAFACIALITVIALLLPRASRRAPPRVVVHKVAAPVVAPVLPAVELWLSTADRRLRLARQPDIAMTTRKALPDDVVIDTKARYQSIVGFGAAITDASAWLLQNRMSATQRNALLRELFGPPPGLDMAMARVTIGASDFSLKPYTLDDLPVGQTDPTLQHFNVTPNLQDVIPVLREALAINPGLRVVASPWSAPAWMKTSANLIGGELLPEDESAYADYLVKYVEAYRGYGIPIFALTVQNEPNFLPVTYPGMQMSATTRARIIGQYLGPALASRAPKTRILDWDHNWDEPNQPETVLADPAASRYVDGIAWHCYRGTASAQSDVHRAYPQKNAYITECSGGDWESARHGELMWFARDLLLAGIRNWARGVVYWNLALDEHYGPHFGGCGNCKGVVTIDSRTGEVSRNDEYYAFAHFSRFVLPGAVRVGSSETDKDLNNVAFQNPDDGTLVLVVVNSHTDARTVSVIAGPTGFRYTMPAQSVATFVWNPDQAASWIRQAFHWWNGVRHPARKSRARLVSRAATPATSPQPTPTQQPASSSTSPSPPQPASSSSSPTAPQPAPPSTSPLPSQPAASSTSLSPSQPALQPAASSTAPSAVPSTTLSTLQPVSTTTPSPPLQPAVSSTSGLPSPPASSSTSLQPIQPASSSTAPSSSPASPLQPASSSTSQSPVPSISLSTLPPASPATSSLPLQPPASSASRLSSPPASSSTAPLQLQPASSSTAQLSPNPASSSSSLTPSASSSLPPPQPATSSTSPSTAPPASSSTTQSQSHPASSSSSPPPHPTSSSPSPPPPLRVSQPAKPLPAR